MKKLDDILKRLEQDKSYLNQAYHVSRLGVFGSVARGEAENTSDIDILVEFEKLIGLDFVELADHLEQVLGAKVDLVHRNAIKPRLWEIIEPQVRYV